MSTVALVNVYDDSQPRVIGEEHILWRFGFSQPVKQRWWFIG